MDWDLANRESASWSWTLVVVLWYVQAAKNFHTETCTGCLPYQDLISYEIKSTEPTFQVAVATKVSSKSPARSGTGFMSCCGRKQCC